MILDINQFVSIVLSEIKSVDGDILKDVATSFTTTMKPMLSTPLRIREVAGAYLSEISDDVLNQLILKYSLEAKNTALCDTTQWDKWEFYTTKWVTFNVAVDSIYNSPIYVGQINGKQYKKLGDFAISIDNSDVGDGAVKRFLSNMECEITKLGVSVKNCREPLLSCTQAGLDSGYMPKPSQNVTKGSGVGRPAFGRTFLASGAHPQWTGYIDQYNRSHLTNARG